MWLMVLAAASRAQTVVIDLDPAKAAAVGLDSAGLEAELSAPATWADRARAADVTGRADRARTEVATAWARWEALSARE